MGNAAVTYFSAHHTITKDLSLDGLHQALLCFEKIFRPQKPEVKLQRCGCEEVSSPVAFSYLRCLSSVIPVLEALVTRGSLLLNPHHSRPDQFLLNHAKCNFNFSCIESVSLL